MKRVLALILCVAMLLTATLSLSSCSTTLEKNSDGTYDKGAFIDIYLGTELYEFDPSTDYIDYEKSQFFSLLFEGLTKLDEDGDWEKAMMKDYSIVTDKMNGDMLIDIELKDTRWSDGRTVQAADFMYAWKYCILDPNNKSEAAAMLFDIKNAKEAKAGNLSMDDVGITCPSTYVLEIRIDKELAPYFDIDRFFTNCASIALVPLREDITAKGDWWAKKMTSMVSNGPFAVKELGFGTLLRIDRNQYYMLDQDEDSNEKLDKYVIPYRLITHYDIGDCVEQMDAYNKGLLYFLGEIPVSKRNEYKSSAIVNDEMNTLSLLLNNTHPVLSDARVRKALSLAIDRQALADLLVFADPATGLIGNGVADADGKGDFRSVGGKILASSADVAAAKNLLNEAKNAGVLKKGEIKLTYRGTANDNPDANEDMTVAMFLADAWNELLKDFGVTVTLNPIKTSEVTVAGVVQLYYTDEFQLAYESGNFDIILFDQMMISRDAFAILAPFAVDYSGNGCDMDSPNYDKFGHVSGYNSEAYEALIEQAAQATTSKDRVKILHDAEAKLLEDMPIIPLLFTKDACLVNSSVLSGLKVDYSASRDFKRVEMKNYMKYKTDYDNSFLSLYSSIVGLIVSTNVDYDKELDMTAMWSPYFKAKDFSMYMTMNEVAEKISAVRGTGTLRKEVLKKIKALVKDRYGVTLDDIDDNSTFYDVTEIVFNHVKGQ